MKDNQSIHKKVQDMCDCYAMNDPLKEMSQLKDDEDKEEAAFKWLALAALHGVNSNAKEIKIEKRGDGNVRVTAEYRTAELPSPGKDAGEKIFDAVRAMTHIEKDKGKTAFTLGIRDSSLDLYIKMKKKEKGEKITIKFP